MYYYYYYYGSCAKSAGQVLNFPPERLNGVSELISIGLSNADPLSFSN
jgi:hypothetical protein